MSASLAGQVLNSTVANALELYYGDEVSETVEFVRKVNDFFDCMNTRHYDEGNNKRNPNLEKFIDPNDTRLDWLLNNFVGYFEQWNVEVENRPGNFGRREKGCMMLSHQTLAGFKITIKSVVEKVRYLLTHGLDHVFTNSFNQDPLEQHFGHYRHKGGSSDNPTVNDVRYTLNHMRVIGSQAMGSIRGNKKRLARNQEIDHTPLPRRKRARLL